MLTLTCVLIPDRILLRDVKALTLHSDRYTTSRRLDPIPQLKCVGGTAGCDAFTPKVIQCQNKGWDGYDVQVTATASAAVSVKGCCVTLFLGRHEQLSLAPDRELNDRPE